MTLAHLTATDIHLREAVMRQLEWDAAVDASAVGVTAKNGVVTLTGFINTYSGKLEAERAAKHVRGVKAVANDVQVRLRLGRTDPEIADDAARALRLRANVPDSVQATVHEGHITLTGEVTWLREKELAEGAVRHLPGIKGVLNHVTVARRPLAPDVQRSILMALRRNADVDAEKIDVTLAGDVVTLTGTAGSCLQRELAERAAADAPGVSHVHNRIVVESASSGRVEADLAC